MSRINVLVAVASSDIKATVLCEAIRARPDMRLLRPEVVAAAAVDELLLTLLPEQRCVVVLVGHPSPAEQFATRWLDARAGLAVMYVAVVGDLVQVVLRDPGLSALLSGVCALVERMTHEPQQRLSVVRLEGPSDEAGCAASEPNAPQPVLNVALAWAHSLLRDAVASIAEAPEDWQGQSVTRGAVLAALERGPEVGFDAHSLAVLDADAALTALLECPPRPDEALAVLHRVLELNALEIRMVVLALAPELDQRHQRCVGYLLDEMARRVGTPALYTWLLGAPARVRYELGASGALNRWALFDAPPGRAVAGDEPLRLDPSVLRWLLGERSSLRDDPRVARLLRLEAWPGISLVDSVDAREQADRLLQRLGAASRPTWIVLLGADPGGWRALAELAAERSGSVPLRVEASRVAALDPAALDEHAGCLARAHYLGGVPLMIDLAAGEAPEDEANLRALLGHLTRLGCQGVLISADGARATRLLGDAPLDSLHRDALSAPERAHAVRAAAGRALAPLTFEHAHLLAARYPLSIDGLEHAARLALQRPLERASDDAAQERFAAACRQVASEGVSRLTEPLEPAFDLESVVLPDDRKRQLVEIIDNVRHATRVLDAWNFRERLPYGRGISALFFGPSGTGKTMAAMAIARALGVQLLRLDLSRVVSKYIGDTEKHVDRALTDAQRSGAAILIDEADALLGKRSEVKDAHDRYANIEVAYLLQRLEAFEGLAILTTNLRQNLDPAFLRRLRFMVEFPRPDADAREQIWRQCLPEGSHELDAACFRLLARRMDLNGGHIRSITLRAAFVAAAADTQVKLEHVDYAARAEFAKLGMPPIDLGVGSPRRAA